MHPLSLQNKKHNLSGGVLTNIVLVLTILAVGIVIALQAMDLMQYINT